MLRILFLTFFIFNLAYGKVTFYGNTVYRVIPKTEAQLRYLSNLQVSDTELDFWTDVSGLGRKVDIRVTPEKKEWFLNALDSLGMATTVTIEDLQKTLDAQDLLRQQTRDISDGFWDDYQTFDAISLWMDEIVAAHPDILTKTVIGTSFENRDIVAIKLSTQNTGKGIFLEGGAHAREWISPATVTYTLHYLLSTQDARALALRDQFDWYFIPVTNPDGYAFSHEENRMWRKTRSIHQSNCSEAGVSYGVDPNRNWDYNWMVAGASDNPCSDIFAGPTPFSEPETYTVAEYINANSIGMEVYLSVHSYSQMLLIPYAHTDQPLDNYDEAYEIGTRAAEALERRHGTPYIVGNTVAVLYEATGGSDDWVKAQFRTRLVYCVELRDDGTHGFLLPADQIEPNSQEFLEALFVLAEASTSFATRGTASGLLALFAAALATMKLIH